MAAAHGSAVRTGAHMHIRLNLVWSLCCPALPCCRCLSQAAVTALAHDEAQGLLMAADRTGALVIWELFDEKENLSATSMLAKVYSEAADIILKQQERKNPAAPVVVADDSRFIEDYAKYWYRFYKYRPSTFRVLIRCQLPASAGHATCCLLLSQVRRPNLPCPQRIGSGIEWNGTP